MRPSIRHYLTRFAIYAAIGLVLNVGLYQWMRLNTHVGFRFSELSHSMQRTANDILHLPITTNKNLQKATHSLLDVADAETILHYALWKWTYRDDARFWDVPTHPIITMAELAGDCDDYARLSAYVLHYKGIRFVYYVALASKDSGHAVAVFYDEKRQTAGRADINGWNELPLNQFSIPFDVEKLIMMDYPDTRHLSIRTWDLKRLLYTLEVGKQ